MPLPNRVFGEVKKAKLAEENRTPRRYQMGKKNLRMMDGKLRTKNYIGEGIYRGNIQY
jgi:hypothetical protein